MLNIGYEHYTGATLRIVLSDAMIYEIAFKYNRPITDSVVPSSAKCVPAHTHTQRPKCIIFFLHFTFALLQRLFNELFKVSLLRLGLKNTRKKITFKWNMKCNCFILKICLFILISHLYLEYLLKLYFQFFLLSQVTI